MLQSAIVTRPIAPVLVSHRAMLLAVVAVAAMAGFAATEATAAAAARAAAGPELAMLLRGMAVLKVAMAAAAVVLIDWRLRQPVVPRVAAAYVGGAAMMAAGPGLIWGLAHVVAGAVVLHTGLALLIGLACFDTGARFRMVAR